LISIALEKYLSETYALCRMLNFFMGGTLSAGLFAVELYGVLCVRETERLANAVSWSFNVYFVCVCFVCVYVEGGGGGIFVVGV